MATTSLLVVFKMHWLIFLHGDLRIQGRVTYRSSSLMTDGAARLVNLSNAGRTHTERILSLAIRNLMVGRVLVPDVARN